MADFVYDTIHADTNPHGIVTRKFLAVWGARVLGQALDPFQYPSGVLLGNILEILPNAGGKFDPK